MVANVYLEGTYTERYPNIPRNETGLQRLFNEPMRNFRIVFDNPDLIACTVIGDGEAETGPLAARLAAVDILRKEISELKIRVVNVVDLMTLQPQSEHPHGLNDHDFNSIFTTDKPIVFAFHGYPWLIHRLTYRRANHNNLHVRGYKEEGTTMTPFDMTVLNEMSRFHLAGMAIERVARVQNRAGYANQRIRGKLLAHRGYICKNGDDMPEITRLDMAIEDYCNKCEVDQVVMLHQKNAGLAPLPRAALRPYPSKYVRIHILKDGTRLRIRPIRPEDEPEMVRFHATLSEHSIYLRYFSIPSLETRTRHERLTRICFIDYDRDLVLVAEVMDENRAGHEIIGVGRLGKLHVGNGAEVAVIVSDRFQRHGVGRALIRELVEFARDENVGVLRALVLAENIVMRHLLEGEGFLFVGGGDLQTLTGELPLLRQ